MAKLQSRNDVRLKRHARVRRKISGTPECPRLNVFRSNAHIHAQIIDDVNGVTLVSASSVEMKLENGGNIAAASAVGKEVAERAIAKEIKNVLPQYDKDGIKQQLGEKSHHAVINALRRFSEFLES